MMEPSLALQGTILSALKGNTPAGQSVFDSIRPNVFPRIQIGGAQVISDDPLCVEGVEVYFQVDVYSRAEGFPEVKEIAWKARDLLHKRPLETPDWLLIDIRLNDAVYTREGEKNDISRARMTLKGYMERP